MQVRKRIRKYSHAIFENAVYFFDKRKEFWRWRMFRRAILLPSLKEYLVTQEKEIISNDNIHYTKENKHLDNPTEEDLVENYISHNGHMEFRKKYTYPGQPRSKKFLQA